MSEATPVCQMGLHDECLGRVWTDVFETDKCSCRCHTNREDGASDEQR